MGYGYDVYDTYDISDDKMEVLIKKDVIEMNNVGLEYIRNHYKKYTALYIDENIEASHNASTQFWILFDIDMNVMLPSNTYNSTSSADVTTSLLT